MNKLFEFGRKAWFMVRVLSGYEERRIRSYRLQLQKQIEQAQERKVALRSIPEQAILKEVRTMVEEMKALKSQLEETETAIEDYFKPIDNNADILMNLQLEKEEKQMKDMMKVMQEQAALQRAAANDNPEVASGDMGQNLSSTTSTQQQNK